MGMGMSTNMYTNTSKFICSLVLPQRFAWLPHNATHVKIRKWVGESVGDGRGRGDANASLSALFCHLPSICNFNELAFGFAFVFYPLSWAAVLLTVFVQLDEWRALVQYLQQALKGLSSPCFCQPARSSPFLARVSKENEFPLAFPGCLAVHLKKIWYGTETHTLTHKASNWKTLFSYRPRQFPAEARKTFSGI